MPNLLLFSFAAESNNPQAVTATVAATALQSSGNINVSAQCATGSATAQNISAQVLRTAEASLSSATAQNTTINVSSSPQLVNVVATVYDVTLESPWTTFEALDASAEIAPPAATGTATATAQDATVIMAATSLAQVATASFSNENASSIFVYPSEASALIVANSISRPAEIASATATAYNASTPGQEDRSAALAGSGSLTAIGNIGTRNSAVLDGFGYLLATGTKVYTGSATLTGIGSFWVPGTPEKRLWNFIDPVTDEIYEFEINPIDVQTLNRTKNIIYKNTLAPQAKSIIFESTSEPISLQWSGELLLESQANTFRSWWEKEYEIELIDDLGRRFNIYLVNFSPKRKRSATLPSRHGYEMEAIILEEILV